MRLRGFLLASLVFAGLSSCTDTPTRPEGIRPPETARHWIGATYSLDPTWFVVQIQATPATLCYTVYTVNNGPITGCGWWTIGDYASSIEFMPGGDPSDPAEALIIVANGPSVDPWEAPTVDTSQLDHPKVDVPCVLDSFPGNDTITAPNVQSFFSSLWKQSNYTDTATHIIQPLANRREQGGFIVQGVSGYIFKPFPSTWTSDACGIDIDTTYKLPAGTVAFIHTHPFKTGETLGPPCSPIGNNPDGSPIYGTYNNEPSGFGGDRTVSFIWNNLPGYILDADKIIRFDAVATYYKKARCAY